jgi:hypothetical protein
VRLIMEAWALIFSLRMQLHHRIKCWISGSQIVILLEGVSHVTHL